MCALVFSPPLFVTKPESMTLFVGKPARLQCVVTGSPPLHIVWQKDNLDIPVGGNVNISVDRNVHILEIRSLQLSDKGLYSCKATNRFGTDLCSAELQVIDKPKKLKPVDSIKGSFAHLECLVSGSLPMSVIWFKDDKEISVSDKFQCTFYENAACLEINRLDSSDSGSYTCMATNQAGSDQCSGPLIVKGWLYCFFLSFFLIFMTNGRMFESKVTSAFSHLFPPPQFNLEPPTITEKPPSKDVLPGSRVQFKVLVSGTPPLTMKWYKDNKDLSLMKPGQSKKFECQVTGTPVITVSWYRDGSEIISSGKYHISFDNSLVTLEITGASVDDSGLYVCEARNEAGSDSCSVEVCVKG
uniref:Ig-like domain-containing protein n=1 Tax=Erpetoichthys calabaricus TaxID=27687 RepID=A0A8C4S6I9_ERPCA